MGIKGLIKRIVVFIKRKEILPVLYPVTTDHEFDGKVALITGGSGGIGFAIAKRLSESGCKVIITGTNEGKLNRIKAEFPQNRVKIFQIDYADLERFTEKIEEIEKLFGRIDIFVNSVGVHTENVDFWKITPDEFDRVININLKGAFFACQLIGKYMKKNKIKGHILLISSSRGSEPAWSPYGISKWGIKGLTEGLAQMFLPYGITVNAIAPGSTATELIGVKEGDSIATRENRVGRYIMPDEVANVAKLLVSDAGNMIVGETIHISGGRGIFDIR